ncbi:MAG: T9SS type A sorting domain-containing protein [Candidatus Coatesbacteria bacterium]|nr:T9SS type A sorting domain-containing protein [Candidatus Coatesbacteria bacterium]
MKRFVLVLLTLAVAVGASWQLETVEDLSQEYSGYCSLVLDSSGYPRIAYKGNSHDIRYAAWDGAAWQIETIEDLSSEYSGYCSLALDSSGYPRLAYKGDVYDIRYAAWDGATWQLETVEETNDPFSGHCSLALDASGYPHLAYQGNGYDIRYGWWNDPPAAFSLLSPADGAAVDDYPLCDWEDSPDPEGGDVSYDLWYSTEDDFDPREELTGLTDSEYQFSDAELDRDTTYFWKVRATDGYDETWSTETWSFYVPDDVTVDGLELSASPVGDGVLVCWTCSGETPAAVRVLRGEENPVAVSGSLPATTVRWLDRGVEPGGSYVYWLEATDSTGHTKVFGPTESVVVSELERVLTLDAPWPSPATDAVMLACELPSGAGDARITIYDLSGRVVESFGIAPEAGRQTISLDTATYQPGVYLACLATDAASETRRFVIGR